MSKERPKFHVTITDNETGETLHDEDACAILASIADEECTQEVVCTECDGNTMMVALGVLCQVEARLRLRHENLNILAPMLRAFAENEVKNEEKGE